MRKHIIAGGLATIAFISVIVSSIAFKCNALDVGFVALGIYALAFVAFCIWRHATA